MKQASVALGALGALFSAIFAIYYVSGGDLYVTASVGGATSKCVKLATFNDGQKFSVTQATFGVTVDSGSSTSSTYSYDPSTSSTHINGRATLLASFSLTLLASVWGFVGSCLVGAEKYPAGLGLYGLAFVFSNIAFIYFGTSLDSDFDIDGRSVPGKVSACMDWGPGLNIGAVLCYAGAIGLGVLVAMGKGGESTPMTNLHTVESR